MEHWDVLQDEVTRAESLSGRPMFGNSFPEPLSGAPLTPELARTVVAPLYDALNQPAKKDVASLLAKATNPDYQSYSTNDDWLNRSQLAEVFKTIGAAVPDLRWSIKDILVSGDQIVVRGEASGTPQGELFEQSPPARGLKPCRSMCSR